MSATSSSTEMTITPYWLCPQDSLGLDNDAGENDYCICHLHDEAIDELGALNPSKRDELRSLITRIEQCVGVLRANVDQIAAKGQDKLSELERWQIGALTCHIEYDENLLQAVKALWSQTILPPTMDELKSKDFQVKAAWLAKSINKVLVAGYSITRSFRESKGDLKQEEAALNDARVEMDEALKAYLAIAKA